MDQQKEIKGVHMSVKLIIGADLVPTKRNCKYFKEGDTGTLIGEKLRRKLHSADFTIFNLESPLADGLNPIDKCGPNLVAPTYTIKGLKAINPHFFTLANNHILDQGEQGLCSTIELLDKAGIKHAGAGKDLEAAKRPCIVEIKGIRVGVYCCAEHEFTIAAKGRAGANPFDPLESLDHVTRLKGQCDYVVVLYHGGKEHYRYPSPYLQQVCRKLAEKGADLVVCQHSHCVGCAEDWDGAKIIYGQGNFLFDHSEDGCWQTSLLIELSLERQGSGVHSVVGYVPLQKMKERVRLATGEEKQRILAEFEKRSEEIKDPQIVEANYQRFADSMFPRYIRIFAGKSTKGFFYRFINRLSGYRFNKWCMNRRYGKQECIAIRNYLQCEAHRELVIQSVKSRGE